MAVETGKKLDGAVVAIWPGVLAVGVDLTFLLALLVLLVELDEVARLLFIVPATKAGSSGPQVTTPGLSTSLALESLDLFLADLRLVLGHPGPFLGPLTATNRLQSRHLQEEREPGNTNSQGKQPKVARG